MDPNSLAVIWDVDGTLVDTAELHFEAWQRLADELGKPFSRAEFAATFGQRNPEIIPRVFGESREARVAELGDRKEELYRAAARKGVALLPGVMDLLARLKAAGFRQAVGSSAPRQNLDLIFELTGIAGCFAAVVSQEDTSKGKPDPEVFLLAAQKLDVPPPHCLVVEDAVAGVQAAKAVGMKCIAVRFAGHHPADRLQAAGADLVVESLERVTVETVRGILVK